MEKLCDDHKMRYIALSGEKEFYQKNEKDIRDFVRARQKLIEENLSKNHATIFDFEIKNIDDIKDKKRTVSYQSVEGLLSPPKEVLVGYITTKFMDDERDMFVMFVRVSHASGRLPCFFRTGHHTISFISLKKKETNIKIVDIGFSKCGNLSCSIEDVKLMRCSKCKNIKYCSRNVKLLIGRITNLSANNYRNFL